MAEELYILHEHASGYALFRVKEFEELSGLDAAQHIQENVTDVSRFNSLVKLIAYAPFRTNANALENVNCVSEGVCHDDLRAFLEANFPNAAKTGASDGSSKKKQPKTVLGVTDTRLASHISESLGFSVRATGVIPEVARGIRLHFPKLVRGLTEQFETTSQRALAHSYSRMKVKFNVNRIDNMIIQAISLLDQLDKDINTFAMRIREWYSYHFPELVRIVPDNAAYCRVANAIGDRHAFLADADSESEEAVAKHALVRAALDDDETRYAAILDAGRSSIGLDIAPVDLINIELFTARVTKLIEYRKQLHAYLVSKMSSCAPNLSALIGEQVGARLIAHAGSLTNLAKYPASTVQILGAEKALFRALKTRSNTPKYGLIYHSTFISRARAALKGRVSRLLANKCSIASRIDCFSDTPTDSFGSALRNQLDARLRFYESQALGGAEKGAKPPRNEETMRQACEEAERVRCAFLKSKRKAEKKEAKAKKRAKLDEDVEADVQEIHEANGNGSPEKLSKKERRRLKKLAEAAANGEEAMVVDVDAEAAAAEEATAVSKKKKKHKN